MLRYSTAAYKLKTKFYDYYNDIDVYVEDEDDEVFYEKLLNNLVGNSVKMTRVFSVGGKVRLFEMVNDYTTRPWPRNVFFIADGDFDRILKRPFPLSERLHVLEEYCIENFLFEEKAVCNVIQEEKPNKKIREIKESIKFHNWLATSVEKLTPLFACFILIQKHNMGIRNVDLGIGKFISNRGIPNLDEKKINKFITEVRKGYSISVGKNFDEEITLVKGMMGKSWRKKKRNICGKNYLLPLLRFEVKRYFRRDLNPKSFRFRLMNHCSFDSLSRMGQHLIESCGA